MWRYPLGPSNTSTSSNPSLFTAGDQLVVPIGALHIFLRLQEIQSREWEKKVQTNNMLGLTQVQKGSYVTLCMCRLTLAWISSETSTKLLGMPTYPDRSSSLLLGSLMPIRLSAVPCRLVTRLTLRQLPSSSPFVQLSSRIPLPTSGHSRSRVQNPLSGFAPKQTKESFAWRTTYIVLHFFLDKSNNIIMDRCYKRRNQCIHTCSYIKIWL